MAEALGSALVVSALLIKYTFGFAQDCSHVEFVIGLFFEDALHPDIQLTLAGGADFTFLAGH